MASLWRKEEAVKLDGSPMPSPDMLCSELPVAVVSLVSPALLVADIPLYAEFFRIILIMSSDASGVPTAEEKFEKREPI